jgi:membrane-associated protein
MGTLLDIFLHLDDKLSLVAQQHGIWVYALLFAVVFCETGLIVFPFLPGDSLLFAAGLLANPTKNALNIWIVVLTFIGAAVIGDSVNYTIGRFVGKRLFKQHDKAWKNKFFKPSHLALAQDYFDRYGARTVIIGRFIPIVRTLTPFVAGQAMSYRKFLAYSISGTIIWVGICCGAGYLFGQIPWVEKNFRMVLLVLAGASILLAFAEIAKSHKKAKGAAAVSESGKVIENTSENA